jgi:hypothetical protein
METSSPRVWIIEPEIEIAQSQEGKTCLVSKRDRTVVFRLERRARLPFGMPGDGAGGYWDNSFHDSRQTRKYRHYLEQASNSGTQFSFEQADELEGLVKMQFRGYERLPKYREDARLESQQLIERNSERVEADGKRVSRVRLDGTGFQILDDSRPDCSGLKLIHLAL